MSEEITTGERDAAKAQHEHDCLIAVACDARNPMPSDTIYAIRLLLRLEERVQEMGWREQSRDEARSARIALDREFAAEPTRIEGMAWLTPNSDAHGGGETWKWVQASADAELFGPWQRATLIVHPPRDQGGPERATESVNDAGELAASGKAGDQGPRQDVVQPRVSDVRPGLVPDGAARPDGQGSAEQLRREPRLPVAEAAPRPAATIKVSWPDGTPLAEWITIEYGQHIPAPSSPSEQGAVWFIERGQPEHQVPTVWWSAYGDKWTADANEATPYPDRWAAVAVIRAKSGPLEKHVFGRATEHVFLAPSEQESGREGALLPCPFCGTDCACTQFSDRRGAWFVVCCKAQTDDRKTAEEAVADWNCRASTKLSDDELSDLATRLEQSAKVYRERAYLPQVSLLERAAAALRASASARQTSEEPVAPLGWIYRCLDEDRWHFSFGKDISGPTAEIRPVSAYHPRPLVANHDTVEKVARILHDRDLMNGEHNKPERGCPGWENCWTRRSYQEEAAKWAGYTEPQP